MIKNNMFLPKNQKFKKQQKNSSFNKIVTVNTLEKFKFGSFGVKSIEFGRISSKQLESVYKCVKKVIKKVGRLTMRVFSHVPITKKPVEVRMGKGKGAVNFWVSNISYGTVLYEIECVSFSLVLKAFNLSKIRLPIKTRLYFQKN